MSKKDEPTILDMITHMVEKRVRQKLREKKAEIFYQILRNNPSHPWYDIISQCGYEVLHSQDSHE